MADQYDLFGGINIRKKVGIYSIAHSSTKSLYIGQSNDIEQRINRHKKELKQSIHPNKNLQKLWNDCGDKEFEFLLLEELNETKSPLETQRWLAEREKYWINKFRNSNDIKTLNITDGEIVKTSDAIVEFKRERNEDEIRKENNRKNYDLKIKEERRDINFRLIEIEKLLNELRSNRKLHSPKLKSVYAELSEYKNQLEKLQKKHSGFFGFFNGKIDINEVAHLKSLIDKLTIEYDSICIPILDEIISLEIERDQLKNSKKKLHSSKQSDYYDKLRNRYDVASYRIKKKKDDFY